MPRDGHTPEKADFLGAEKLDFRKGLDVVLTGI
jgi:hypothetical protein